MSEWFESQRKASSNFRKLLKERIEKANPRRNLTAEEIKEALKKKILIKTLKVLPVLIFILWFAYTVYNH